MSEFRSTGIEGRASRLERPPDDTDRRCRKVCVLIATSCAAMNKPQTEPLTNATRSAFLSRAPSSQEPLSGDSDDLFFFSSNGEVPLQTTTRLKPHDVEEARLEQDVRWTKSSRDDHTLPRNIRFRHPDHGLDRGRRGYRRQKSEAEPDEASLPMRTLRGTLIR